MLTSSCGEPQRGRSYVLVYFGDHHPLLYYGISVSICFVHLLMCTCLYMKRVSVLSLDHYGECGALNESDLHRLLLERLFPCQWDYLGMTRRCGLVGGTVMGGHLSYQKMSFWTNSLWVPLASPVRSQPLLPPCLPSNHHDIVDQGSSHHGLSSLGTLNPTEGFLLWLPWSWCFATAIEKKRTQGSSLELSF